VLVGRRFTAKEDLTFANLHMGNALPTYSESGYGYAVEKAPTTKGWSYPVYEELWNYGFPQEMHHFARCARGKETPTAHRRGRLDRPGSSPGRLSLGPDGREDRPTLPPHWHQAPHRPLARRGR